MNIASDMEERMDDPWMFAASRAQPTALALARAGGRRGQTFLYTDDPSVSSSPALGGGFEAGGGNKDGAYLPPNRIADAWSLPTPPSSMSPPHAIRIPASSSRPAGVAPLSPPSSVSSHPYGLQAGMSSRGTSTGRDCTPALPLISSVFPYSTSSVASASYMLEIVTPPSHVLSGFVTDDTTLGRIVFVHLLPSHSSAPSPPDPLAPHFSDVLRPHDPSRPHPVSSPSSSPTPAALDIRESLTALLDLADELEAAQLILVLDKDEREPAPLAALMHALMYVGGTPVRPGAPVGEWEWDSHRFALVSIEL